MTNEEKILAEFKKLAQEDELKAKKEAEAKPTDIEPVKRKDFDINNYKLKKSFQIVDVTPEGYGV